MASFAILSANVIVGNESISTHAFKSLASNKLTIGPRDNVNGTITFLADVGVRTLNPTSALHVAGSAHIDNSVTALVYNGSGAGLTNLNAGNFSAGTVPVSRGGTGSTEPSTGTGGVVLANSAVLANSTFTGTVIAGAIATGSITALAYNGSGAGLTDLNAANFTAGLLSIARGGTGSSSATGSGSLVLDTSPSLSGTVTIGQTAERIELKTGATGIVPHDYASSAIFHHSSMVASFTCNLTNVPTTTSRTITIALILVQGATPRMPSALQIDGVAQPILWANGITPTGTASKTDVCTFSLIRANSAWIALGQNQFYG